MTEALKSVLAERERQDAKWGEQNHDPFTYLAVLGEEYGETCQAALHSRFGGKHAGSLREEAVHTAAVALAIVECIDRGKWSWPGVEPVVEEPVARYIVAEKAMAQRPVAPPQVFDPNRSDEDGPSEAELLPTSPQERCEWRCVEGGWLSACGYMTSSYETPQAPNNCPRCLWPIEVREEAT